MGLVGTVSGCQGFHSHFKSWTQLCNSAVLNVHSYIKTRQIFSKYGGLNTFAVQLIYFYCLLMDLLDKLLMWKVGNWLNIQNQEKILILPARRINKNLELLVEKELNIFFLGEIDNLDFTFMSLFWNKMHFIQCDIYLFCMLCLHLIYVSLAGSERMKLSDFKRPVIGHMPPLLSFIWLLLP